MYKIIIIQLCYKFYFKFLSIDFREREEGEETERKRGGERERERDLLFHLLMHSLVDSYMCPDQGLNPQPWCIRMTL